MYLELLLTMWDYVKKNIEPLISNYLRNLLRCLNKDILIGIAIPLNK